MVGVVSERLGAAAGAATATSRKRGRALTGSGGRYTPPAMSKVCAVCGKKPSFGHSRSHSMVATKRRFNPNLQRVRVRLGGKATRAYVCTRCLRTGQVEKAL